MDRTPRESREVLPLMVSTYQEYTNRNDKRQHFFLFS
jgi:hypothetical protein